jgi:putative peptidoglycan lipid II flippase
MSSNSASVQALTVNRRIFSAVSAVTLAALVVKLAATMKEFAVAGIFGRGDALEAFLIAALVPGLLVNLVSESMNQALIPTLVRVRTLVGRERAQQLLSNALVCTCVLLLLASMGMALTARFFFPLIGSHFAAAKLNLAIHLFYGLLPVVVLAGIASLFTAVLNTTGTFALPALAPVVTPLTIIVAVPILTHSFGIWAMVYGTVVGALLHAMWTGWMMKASEYRLVLRWYGMCESTREVGRQYGPVFLSGLVASGGLIVDQSMAAMLPAGSVSALAYAGRFVSVALALLGGAFSSAVTPFFSELVARGDWNRCRRTLHTWAWWSAGVATSVASVLIIGSRALVRLALQHGAFGPRDTSVVSSVLIIYALQIPFFVCSRVYYRFLVAMRRTDLVFYCGLLNLGLDVGLNLLLMPRFGVAGIALSTSFWSASTLIFLAYWSLKILPNDRADRPNREG